MGGWARRLWGHRAQTFHRLYLRVFIKCGRLKKSIDKNALLGVGGEALKVIKTKREKMMKNQTKKKSFFLYIKKPLNAACYDRCLILMLCFVGEIGEQGWRVWVALPHALGPSSTPLGTP